MTYLLAKATVGFLIFHCKVGALVDTEHTVHTLHLAVKCAVGFTDLTEGSWLFNTLSSKNIDPTEV